MPKKKAKVILLIEDDAATIDVYTIAFTQAGFRLEVIKLGSEAVARFADLHAGKKKKPDLVLLDLILPDMNGVEVLKLLREHESLQELPVFILSNYTYQEAQRRGYDLNSEKFLLKADYTPKQLIALIEERLGE